MSTKFFKKISILLIKYVPAKCIRNVHKLVHIIYIKYKYFQYLIPTLY